MRQTLIFALAVFSSACGRTTSPPKTYGPLTPFSAAFTDAVGHLTGIGTEQDAFLGTVELTKACEGGDRDACDYAWLAEVHAPYDVPSESISPQVTSHAAEVRRCYESSNDFRWGVEGKLPVTFMFDHRGRVFIVSESEPTKFSRELVTCVKRVVLGFHFSASREEPGAATVSVPFGLKRD